MSSNDRREQLGRILKNILGSNEVYYQDKPNNNTFPRILYTLSRMGTDFANNRPYLVHRAYMVTLMTKAPDHDINDQLVMLPACLFDRHYISNGVHHYVYTIYI